jgi:hypothetical protein
MDIFRYIKWLWFTSSENGRFTFAVFVSIISFFLSCIFFGKYGLVLSVGIVLSVMIYNLIRCIWDELRKSWNNFRLDQERNHDRVIRTLKGK